MTLIQWYEKIKSSVPLWFFEEEIVQKAVLYGWARVFYELEQNIDAHILETFISTSTEDFLAEHGAERTIEKEIDESEARYRLRIRNITNKSNKTDMKALIDALLLIGECTLIDDFSNTLFASRETFVNRGFVLIENIENTFSILIDKQIHAPYAYASREYFSNREDFVSSIESNTAIFNLIINTVNRAKAFGTLYRLIERAY